MGPDNYFAYLPEYTLQNIVDNFKFIFRYVLQLLENFSLNKSPNTVW